MDVVAFKSRYLTEYRVCFPHEIYFWIKNKRNHRPVASSSSWSTGNFHLEASSHEALSNLIAMLLW